ncbi:MAG: VanZ family protein [Oscillospiraceae bacterium]|jgi:glycopeptide antibiotics resistance protein|nr:VanZ family protein [Oscillospiraceae bacterium]MDD3261024.1 VanZ family protein [Oscillospiraceae bacterium]
MENKKQRRVTTAFFIFYLFLLTWLVMLKLQTNVAVLDRYRQLNLVPFQASFYRDGRLDLFEIVGNILAFMPFGIYLKMLWPERPFFKTLLPCFLVSLTFETLQYVLAVGTSDITDLLDNTLGGALGIGVYWIFQKLLKGKTNKVLNILLLVLMVLALALVAAMQ